MIKRKLHPLSDNNTRKKMIKIIKQMDSTVVCRDVPDYAPSILLDFFEKGKNGYTNAQKQRLKIFRDRVNPHIKIYDTVVILEPKICDISWS